MKGLDKMIFFNKFDEMLSKNGVAIVLMSRELLSKSVDERIDTVENYAKKLNVGRGTIQYAIKFIADYHAVTFEARGHLGTYIRTINSKKLLELSAISSITCSMPLPYSLRYEGLATGLYTSFNKSEIPFNIGYTRGANKRIEQLKNEKVDFIVLSKSAAEIAICEVDHFEILLEFDDYSYVGERVLIFRDKNESVIRPGMRVALDSTSTDHVTNTEAVCKGNDVTFVEGSYAQIMKMLQTEAIDVATWNGDELWNKSQDFNIVPTKSDNIDDMKAVILSLKESKDINNIIKNFVNKDAVKEVQNMILRGEMIPNY